MIELFAHPSPNPLKIVIALEEMALPYRITLLDPFSGAADTPAYRELSPNGKVPSIVDHDTGARVFESNAILCHLAHKTGTLLPSDEEGRMQALQWLFFQASSVGPMYGQRAWFSLFAPEKIAYAVDRYETEARRLDAVIDRQLRKHRYFLGEYSIVDVACFGWSHTAVMQGFTLAACPAYARWYTHVLSRPAVRRALDALGPLPDFGPLMAARRAYAHVPLPE